MKIDTVNFPPFRHTQCIFRYEPKSDITVYELARIVPLMGALRESDWLRSFYSLPDECRRHFVSENHWNEE